MARTQQRQRQLPNTAKNTTPASQPARPAKTPLELAREARAANITPREHMLVIELEQHRDARKKFEPADADYKSLTTLINAKSAELGTLRWSRVSGSRAVALENAMKRFFALARGNYNPSEKDIETAEQYFYAIMRTGFAKFRNDGTTKRGVAKPSTEERASKIFGR